MKTPDFRDRLSAARAAKKAQLERARAIAEDPERLKRIEARSQIIVARNSRVAEPQGIFCIVQTTSILDVSSPSGPLCGPQE
jgi:hypothetical protein